MIQTAPCGPDDLTDAIIAFVARKAGISQARIRDLLERIVEEAGPDAIGRLQARLGEPAEHWGYYEGEPLARRVHHQLAPIVLQEPPSVACAAHLDQVRGRPAIIVANHLSYSDSVVTRQQPRSTKTRRREDTKPMLGNTRPLSSTGISKY